MGLVGDRGEWVWGGDEEGSAVSAPPAVTLGVPRAQWPGVGLRPRGEGLAGPVLEKGGRNRIRGVL